MRFSVVIPCHNSGPWIGDTLRSAAEQIHPPHEIVVIDDASVDDTVEQVRATKIDVKLLSVEVRSAAAARDVAIKASNGDWIALLDSQDIWYPDHLAHAAQLLSNSEDLAYNANVDPLDGETIYRKTLPAGKLETETRSGIRAREFFDLWCEGRLAFHNQTAIYRRDRLVEIGGHDSTLRNRHDIDLWLRAIEGHTCTHEPRSYAAWRIDVPHGLSRKKANVAYFTMKMLLKHRERYAGSAMKDHIRRAAPAAITTAFVTGERQRQRDALEIALPYLTGRAKTSLRLLSRCPPLLTALARQRARRKARHDHIDRSRPTPIKQIWNRRSEQHAEAIN